MEQSVKVSVLRSPGKKLLFLLETALDYVVIRILKI